MNGIQISKNDYGDITISGRSTLYHIEPLGWGTIYVESMASYINRLATYHNVSTINLLRYEISKYLNNEKLIKIIQKGRLSCQSKYVNGSSSWTVEFYKAVEHLVKIPHLERLTINPFNNYGISIKGLLKDYRSWCPICYQEQLNQHGFIYDQLLWSLNVVTTCNKHSVKLVNSCPNCNQKFRVILKSLANNICFKCGFDLSKCNVKESTDGWDRFVNDNIGELICEEPLVQSSNLVNNILVIRSKRGTLSTISKNSSINSSTIANWRINKSKPMLSYILRLCYATNITVIKIINSKIDLRDSVIKNINEIGNFRNKLPRNSGNLSRTEIINLLVEIILEDVNPPPTINDVASVLKKTPNMLRKHFPKLSNIILYRRNRYNDWKRKQKSNMIYNLVKSASYKIYKTGVYPSSKLVTEHLNIKGLFIKPEAIQARNDFLEENNIDKRFNKYN